MAGIVYLRTNRFEVKLEGITFRTRDFESLCAINFLFPDGKSWARPPIVGLDVMRHPRDPSTLLVLLCFGIGCVILKFRSGEALPAPIHDFLSDKRIRFVGFGIPEKKDLFPFDELRLSKNKVDIGYLAAKVLKDPKYKACDLAVLARKVLGIKRMIGMAEASWFERHEPIKCAICQLFITSVIAMGLLGDQDKKTNMGLLGAFDQDKKKLEDSPKRSSFLKNLNSLHLLAEGWFKLPKIKKRDRKTRGDEEKGGSGDAEDELGCDFVSTKWATSPFISCFPNARIHEDDCDRGVDVSPFKTKDYSSSDELFHVDLGNKKDIPDNESVHHSREDFTKEGSFITKKPLKGILKCPSSNDLLRCNSIASNTPSPPSTSKDQMAVGTPPLKRANSKGFNVSFTCRQDLEF